MFTPSAFLSPIKERALDFYVGKLGFEKRMDASFGAGQRWLEVAPAGAVTTIALVPTREGVPTGVETGIRFLSEDAEADHANLLARGVDADPEIMRFGGGCHPCSTSATRTATAFSSSSAPEHRGGRALRASRVAAAGLWLDLSGIQPGGWAGSFRGG